MRANRVMPGVVVIVVLGAAAGTTLGQQGIGERVGERVQDVGRSLRRGVRDVGDAVRRRFEIVRTDVQRMEAQSRVYSRLHWEKDLHGSRIEVHMLRDGTALLQGTVADQDARERAVEITRNTVGITSVIDEMTPLVNREAPRPAPDRTSRRSQKTQSEPSRY